MYTEGEPRDKQPRMASPVPRESHSRHGSGDNMSNSSYNEHSMSQMAGMHYNDLNRMDDSPGSPNSDLGYIPSRKQREFIPENRKDNFYWEKRRKNNEAARRSREKRRLHDYALENQICDIQDENRLLRKELIAVKKKFGVPLDKCFTVSDEEHSDTSLSGPQGGIGPIARPGGGGASSAAAAPHPPHPDSLSQTAAYTSPPPLLAVAGAVPISVPVQGLPYTNGATFPYYLMPEAHSRMHPDYNAYRARSETQRMNSDAQEGNSVPSTSSSSIRPGAGASLYSHGRIKSEPEDDGIRRSQESRGRDISPEIAPTRGEYQHHIDHDSQNEAWLDSNSNSFTSDDDLMDEPEPLRLTVNIGSKDGDSSSQMQFPTNRRDVRSPTTTLPLKLRHKEFFSGGHSSSSYSSHPYMDGLAQLSEIALAQANPLPLVKKRSREFSRDHNLSDLDIDPKFLDPKYLERRRRNNEAARKCRENRKSLTRLREAKSDYLEGENNKLRNEVGDLSDEVQQLRHMIDKKHADHDTPGQPSDPSASPP